MWPDAAQLEIDTLKPGITQPHEKKSIENGYFLASRNRHTVISCPYTSSSGVSSECVARSLAYCGIFNYDGSGMERPGLNETKLS